MGLPACSAFLREKSVTGGGPEKSRHQEGGEMVSIRKREERTCPWRVCLSIGLILSLMLYAVPSSDMGLNLLSEAWDSED